MDAELNAELDSQFTSVAQLIQQVAERFETRMNAIEKNFTQRFDSVGTKAGPNRDAPGSR